MKTPKCPFCNDDKVTVSQCGTLVTCSTHGYVVEVRKSGKKKWRTTGRAA